MFMLKYTLCNAFKSTTFLFVCLFFKGSEVHVLKSQLNAYYTDEGTDDIRNSINNYIKT